MLRAIESSGAHLAAGRRVVDVRPAAGSFVVRTVDGDVRAEAVVLATGGLSLPKTGSDGSGLEIARRLGHSIVPTTPALVPLVALNPSKSLAGIAHDAAITVWIDGRASARLGGSLLWTHFGISGPAALDASRHWLRGELEGARPAVTVALAGARGFDQIDDALLSFGRARPRASLSTMASSLVPTGMADELLRALRLDGSTTAAHLPRDDRRRLAGSLAAWPVAVTGSRGYNFAEATAGGVSVTEIDASTMQSRACPGLFVVGEMLDVDGRLGGFNFQWAWSSAFVAGRGAARFLSAKPASVC